MSFQQQLELVKKRSAELKQEIYEIEQAFQELETQLADMFSKHRSEDNVISHSFMSTGYPTILHAKHIAEILEVSQRRAYEIMDLKSFPLIRIGRSKRVNQVAFFQWLEQQQQLESIV